ncbi:formimidoylglutamate deiminase [Streptomyces iconiensis]|uniref:Formimidoylglutamate deiminase n=1 Tax=Streptomyces iconiensis TaxID=1384038 RepID=A0ABT7A632_9ACTN|nr:formimidoylglutamate deiminase [Streptomyces iconiensis]MDJ1136803.1 formimidoylglutamate deiminase [Streptomyces iconiensis]
MTNDPGTAAGSPAPEPAAATGPAYWLEHAWLGDRVAAGVLLRTAGEHITELRTGVATAPPRTVPLRGLTLPGLANAHSHAFHRALRSLAQTAPDGGPPGCAPDSFWAWREIMYATAARLDPDSYYELARAVYAEMALAGITAVGEFHYLHHSPDGTPYADPNAMGLALAAAADEAGVRLTLLDTAYLSSGFGAPPEAGQRRFSDGTADAWATRAGDLKDGERLRIGAAVHSVRAVPADELGTVAAFAAERDAPLHVHLSEQTAENEACLAVHGTTPTRLLADHGVLGPSTTGIHNTHLTEADIALLGSTGTGTCMCPTTERDLADGIGPAVALDRAGSPLSLGSDSHAVIDLLEEARALELDERLRTRTRGHWTAAQLLAAATSGGHRALGWPEAGRLAVGALADLTTVDLTSVRTAGADPRHGAETAVFAASAADIRHTVVGGQHLVRDGIHTKVADVPGALAGAITALRG